MEKSTSQQEKEITGAKSRVKRDKDFEDYSLLYATNNNGFTEINKIKLEDNSETTLISQRRLGDFAGLDYDYQQNRLYWADSFTIYRSFLTGSGVEIVHSNLLAVKGIAVDWLGDNIFWTDEFGIRVSKTDGRFLKTLVRNPDYTGIVLDPERGYMYWIHWGVTSTNIMSAHMSHGGGELLNIQVFEPRGMAIDYSEQLPYRRVFYADLLLGKGVVKKADFHMSQSYSVQNTPHPYSIFVFQDILYWSEWSTDSILKANISNYDVIYPSHPQTIRSHANFALDIKIVHRNIQRGYNLCSQLKPCTHLCLADTNRRFQCACPDNMKTLRQLSGNVTCLCEGADCKQELPSSSIPPKPAQLSLSSTAAQQSPLPSPSIPKQYSMLPTSTMSLELLSPSTTSHHLQLPASSSPIWSSELLLPSTSWKPSKFALPSPSPQSSGIHLLSTPSPLHSTYPMLQSSELLLPSTSLLHSQLASSSSAPQSPHSTGPGKEIIDPTASGRNSQHEKPSRPYWAIGVAVVGVIHILIAAYIIRKKLCKPSRRQAFVVFDETQSYQEVQLPQLGQPHQEGHP